MKLAVVILTHNEELHLERCINSVLQIANEVYVVDSYSNDRTSHIAHSLNAIFIQNEFTNHATQFNWALNRINSCNEWVMRLDADEIVTNELAKEIKNRLDLLNDSVSGVYVKRKIRFLGKTLNYGGLSSFSILRIFRNGMGRSETRWMDEHIVVTGGTVNFHSNILDYNLNSLTWWTAKHNVYACKEAIDYLERVYKPHRLPPIDTYSLGMRARIKRFFKNNVYYMLPPLFRAFLYFVFRYFVLMGFLDGRAGAAYSFLQAFWYRYLVDLKILEIRTSMKANDIDFDESVRRCFNIKINAINKY